MEILDLEQLKGVLRNAGVVGAGGAGFPTYAKLSEKADTVIINCAECEPLLKLHRQVLENYTEDILCALDEVLKFTGAERGIIALKSHYKNAVAAVERELPNHPKISVCKLESVYPSGDELILLQRVTGRTVKPGALPISVGVIVCNVESVYNISRALNGESVTHKFVTIAGEVNQPKTLYAPIGTKISELLSFAGGSKIEEYALISGGPMMGRLITESDYVTKTTNAVLVLPKNHTVVLNKLRNPKIGLRRAMSVCCQCRSCTELCSRHVAGYPVEPHMVMRVLSNGGKGDINAIAGAMYCSGCGLCEAYSCPQDLSPRVMIDAIKQAARQNGIKPIPMDNTPIPADSDYKKVSVARLTSRLALKKYDVSAPMVDGFDTKKVRILMSQHIGAPAKPIVKKGDKVSVGDLIAQADEKTLGVSIHASIDGVVKTVNDRYIEIAR